MLSVNEVRLAGNLGRDPEVRYKPTGEASAVLQVATTSHYTDPDTRRTTTETRWHRVVCYGALAQNVEKFCRKGSTVYIAGSLKTREYTKDNQKRYITEVVANVVQFVSGTKNAPHNEAPPASSREPSY